jgi:hypothetical protein
MDGMSTPFRCIKPRCPTDCDSCNHAVRIKERPILFSGPMIRALLDGTKTQTRRVVKPQPYAAEAPAMKARVYRPGVAIFGVLADAAVGDEWVCPYGSNGERLWVREAFAFALEDGRVGPRPDSAIYRADDNDGWAHGWKPSIHMPRFASRILLEITDVRVERLQDISEADARAEGFSIGPPPCIDDPIGWYRRLWDQINGSGAWDANPWVWAISFKRIKP